MPPKEMSTDAVINAFDNEDSQHHIKELINDEETVKNALRETIEPAINAAIASAIQSAMGPAIQSVISPAIQAALGTALQAALGPFQLQFNNKITEVQATVQGLKTDLQFHTETIIHLELANSSLQNKFKDTNSKLKQSEQYSSRDNLIITGITAS